MTLESTTRVWNKRRANHAKESTSYERCKRLLLDNVSVLEQLVYFEQKRRQFIEIATCSCIFLSLFALWMRGNGFSFTVLLPLDLLVCYYTERLLFLFRRVSFYLEYPDVYDNRNYVGYVDYKKKVQIYDQQLFRAVMAGFAGCALLFFVLLKAHFMAAHETWTAIFAFFCLLFAITLNGVLIESDVTDARKGCDRLAICIALTTVFLIVVSSPVWTLWAYLYMGLPTFLFAIPLSCAHYAFYWLYRGWTIVKWIVILLFALFKVFFLLDLCSPTAYTFIWMLIFLMLLCASVKRLYFY